MGTDNSLFLFIYLNQILKLGISKKIKIIVLSMQKKNEYNYYYWSIKIYNNKGQWGERFHFMVKKSFISVISHEEKEENRGSAAFQILNLTNRIRKLSSHLELHRKDYLSQRGLRKILGKRQRMLSYLSKKNTIRYKELITQLDIRESKKR